jgi:hypothetical protein
MAIVAAFLYTNKRDFLLRVAQALPDSASETERLFTLSALQPMLNDVHTVRQERIQKSLDTLETTAYSRLKLTGIANIPATPVVMTMSLEIARDALAASREYLGTAEEKKQLETLFAKLVGLQAQVKTGDITAPALKKELAASLSEYRPLFQSLSGNPRVKGFGSTLASLDRYLSAAQ